MKAIAITGQKDGESRTKNWLQVQGAAETQTAPEGAAQERYSFI
jgi:hypothetical protein